MAYFKGIHNKKTDQWRWQLVEDNNKVTAHGETHPTRPNVVRAMAGLTASANEASSREVVWVEEDGED